MSTRAITPPAWMEDGLCAQVNPELFFPEAGGSNREAKAICTTCPVLTQCRDYALADPTLLGVWGGTSERERRTWRRRTCTDCGQVLARNAHTDHAGENAA